VKVEATDVMSINLARSAVAVLAFSLLAGACGGSDRDPGDPGNTSPGVTSEVDGVAATRVLVLVDGTDSAKDQGTHYTDDFEKQLLERAIDPLVLSMAVMGKDVDVTRCETIEKVQINSGSNEVQPTSAWLTQAKAVFADAKPIFACAASLQSLGSELSPWGLVDRSDPSEVWLYTDGLEATPLAPLDWSCLADDACVDGVIASIPESDQLDGRKVRLVGLGWGAGLSKQMEANLERYWIAAVEGSGGTIVIAGL
jgi:hypothetical protein